MDKDPTEPGPSALSEGQAETQQAPDLSRDISSAAGDEVKEHDELVEEDLLVEEISIDGMCGVY